MATSFTERLFGAFPFLQILVVVAGGAGTVISGLPADHYESTVGAVDKIHNKDVVPGYSSLGGTARFIPTVVTAVTSDYSYALVTFMLLVCAVGAYLLAASQDDSSAGHNATWRERVDRLVREREPRTVRHLAWIGGALVAVVISQVLTLGLFTAPLLIRDIGVRISSPNNQAPDRDCLSGTASDDSTWPVLRGLGQRRQCQKLYALFFGMAGNRPPEFVNQRSRSAPTSQHLAGVQEHYRWLGRISVWTLLILTGLTCLSAISITRASSRQRILLVIVLLVASSLHVYQWTLLASAYGRLHVPTRFFEQVIATASDLPMPVWPQRPTWPFARLHLLPGNPLTFEFVWPLRPGGPVLQYSCTPEGAQETITVDLGAPETNGNTTRFPQHTVRGIVDACKSDEITFSDGYSSIVPLSDFLKQRYSPKPQ